MTFNFHTLANPHSTNAPVDPHWIEVIREQCEILEQHLRSERPDFEFVRRHAALILQFCEPI